MRKPIIFVSVFLLFLQVPGILYGAIPASERAALIALYNDANGDNWFGNDGWKDGTLEPDGFGPIGSEGTWYGITVSGDHVIEIDLHENNLRGNISAKLGNLTHLEYLHLGGYVWEKTLTGGIPPELGNLSSLKYLNLSWNRLSGSIPPELGNLVNLEYLYLDNNELGGGIPAELGNLKNLVYLYLGTNELYGSIPPELGSLDNLAVIDLHFSRLNGTIPSELGNLTHLESLSLSLNFLTGSIPPELGNLNSLVTLELHNNALTGSIPTELGNLDNLETLILSSNELSGNIPMELGNLNNLRYLKLNSNRLTGGIPPELGNLSFLDSLYLDNNRLTGSIPTELGNLIYLNSLIMNSNSLTGPIPINFINLTMLQYFRIDYNGLYAHDAALQSFLNSLAPDWQDTQTIAPENVSAAAVSTSSITVSWTPILYTGNDGGYRVYYSITGGGNWTCAGMTANKAAASYKVTGLIPGTKYYIIVRTQTDWHANNLKNTVISEPGDQVWATTFNIPPEQDKPPFGIMELPPEEETPVSGSIAVSGWALDDVEVAGVQIYLVTKGGKAYIGDAVFVEGARPDVEQSYPDYPNNQKAGWGYMLLTNFLPDGGCGIYTLQAIAKDSAGHEITLGSKTILCDNINAEKPFGAIDTPEQGGIAFGSSYINNGWVLTPWPNKIPEDGSTINVYVDGVLLGHPIYNAFRQDIADLFPWYANSDGAWAYFELDTTAYTNGLHQIYWTAADDAGNTEGIGSRYFTVRNSMGNSQWSIVNGQWSIINDQWSMVNYYLSIGLFPQAIFCKALPAAVCLLTTS